MTESDKKKRQEIDDDYETGCTCLLILLFVFAFPLLNLLFDILEWYIGNDWEFLNKLF